jgi:hypothetical protein
MVAVTVELVATTQVTTVDQAAVVLLDTLATVVLALIMVTQGQLMLHQAQVLMVALVAVEETVTQTDLVQAVAELASTVKDPLVQVSLVEDQIAQLLVLLVQVVLTEQAHHLMQHHLEETVVFTVVAVVVLTKTIQEEQADVEQLELFTEQTDLFLQQT